MTPFEEILRRKRQRQAWDERLPDGRSVSEVLNDQSAGFRRDPNERPPRDIRSVADVIANTRDENRRLGGPLWAAGRQISAPSNERMERVFADNPQMRDIALGENYGGSPGLYRISRQGDNVSIKDLGDPSSSPVLTERNREVITRPRRTYNTSLDPEEEARFELWKQRYAPDDSGEDYDLRGAFRAGVTPDVQTGHWPDQFKKPNHPTFSNESQYAVGSDAATAGSWSGEDFVPANRSAVRQRAATFNPATGRPNEGYYRERNDPAGLYNAYQNWTPHGGKRGFKNALKAGALAAAQIAQNNKEADPAAILSAFGIGAAGGAVNPNFKNNLVRGFKLRQIGGELENQLDLQKTQAAIDASQMVPVTLDNGQTVMVPAKTAGTLQSRQQEIDLRGNTLEARKKRWGQLGEHEAARDAQALYNSGAADDSAELRAEIAKRLRLPAGTVLPPRGLGNQIKVDDLGNYVVISPRSGEVTDTGRGSFAKTQEQGRETRQRRALEAAKERVQMQQSGATQRAGMRGAGVRVDAATKREISRGVGSLEAVKNELSDIDARIKQIDDSTKGRQQTPDEVQRLTVLGRQRQQKVNEAKSIAAQLDSLDPNSETGVGEGGYPYRKPRAAQEDAKIRAYADQFFGGDYDKAVEAIKRQRSQ